jgi:hypothetical protein
MQFLINTRDRWVWIFQQATTAKEILTALREHFRPESQFKEIARQSAKLLKERGDIPAHVLYSAWESLVGCPHVKSIHVPRRRRLLRHDALGHFAPAVVRVHHGVEGDA